MKMMAAAGLPMIPVSAPGMMYPVMPGMMPTPGVLMPGMAPPHMGGPPPMMQPMR